MGRGDLLRNGTAVELREMLSARERRAERQRELLERQGLPMICFTMNIAGPVKNSPLIRRGFALGLEELRLSLCREKLEPAETRVFREDTGNEAFFSVNAPKETLKRLACALEEEGPAGRLFDLDVLYPDPSAPNGIGKLGRAGLGLPERRCLLCGGPAAVCASRRLHSVESLQAKTEELLLSALRQRETERIAEYGVRALLWEVAVTPKPGLVDRCNSGSHRDMDIFTFLAGAASLQPWFLRCAELGWDTAGGTPEETFRLLRAPGLPAENRMLRATGGVNTHKGAVFSMGIAAAAAGRLLAAGEDPSAGRLCGECGNMTAGLTEADLGAVTEENAVTAGQKLYARFGITGIRGQLEAGLPAVTERGYPALKRLLAAGRTRDEAGAAALLELLACTDDTALMHRGGVERGRAERARAEELLRASPERCPDRGTLEELDRTYIRENLSPGGCADLLALCWFLLFLEEPETGEGTRTD